MRITYASSEKLIIDGVVPIDQVPPLKKNGKPDSPDPLIRICHQAKKTLQKTMGVTVAYYIRRPTTAGNSQITEVIFIFSNTGDGYVSTKYGDLEKVIDKYCGIMSAMCADMITEYLDGLEFEPQLEKSVV